LQEVVLAGVTALVATPFGDAELWQAVDSALANGSRTLTQDASGADQPRGRGQAIVVAVHSPKGGTGVSVIAANLAVALQEQTARRVALLELAEGPGSMSILLNLPADRTLGDLLARFDAGDVELMDGVMARHASGLRVLLAPPTAGVRLGADVLQDITSCLRQMYDLLVIDLHTSARVLVPAIVAQAHVVMLVMIPEMPALHHARVFMQGLGSSHPEVRANLLLNRVNMPSGIPVDAIRRHLKVAIAAEVPDDPGLVAASVNRGVPFVSSHPRSGAARAVCKLAADLAAEAAACEAPGMPVSSILSPLQRLTGAGRRG
jgi:pilus assembly protein CpaE